MPESPLQKVITFENNQLLCNGEPISIEEAEIIVQEQVREQENTTAALIKNTPQFEQATIETLSDSLNMLRYHAATSDIATRGIEEYKSAAADITRAHEISDRALQLFSPNRKKQPKPKVKMSNFKPEEWPLNVNNDPDYEPTMDELYEKYHEIIFQELIYKEFRNQFFNADVKIEKEDIKVYGNLVNEYRVHIQNNDITIYFQINENNGSFGDISGFYIGSALQVGSVVLQNNRENFLKHGNNNFKTAQTIENLIVKQVRYLKNTIKQEINFSLEQNISKAEERLNIANVFIENYGPLLDKKTKARLYSLIKEAKKPEKGQKVTIIRYDNKIPEAPAEKKQAGGPKLLDDKTALEAEVKKQLLIAFETDEEKIKLESRQKEDYLLFDAFIAGQKINLNIHNFIKVFVSSTNTLGTGKTDFQQTEIQGIALADKIKTACYMAALPLLNRQIENLVPLIKGNEAKKILKIIENNLKELILVINDFNKSLDTKIPLFIVNTNTIIDNLIIFNDQIIEGLLNITEKLMKRTNEIIAAQMVLVINQKSVELAENNSEILTIYHNAIQEGYNLPESLNEVKKYIKRRIYSNIIIKELNDYKILLDNNKDKEQKETIIKEIETTIKQLADFLSEDEIVGGIARKVLALMDTSMSSRDDLFKYHIENIIMEIIKLR